MKYYGETMSYGQSLLRDYLKLVTDYPFIENYRPEWLHGMEIDFYFPDLKFGIEFQGDQHFINTDRFGPCKDQRHRDWQKRQLCKDQGVLLQQFVAIDLRQQKIRSKLRWAFKTLNRRRIFRKGVWRASHKHLWREISDRAIQYRKNLRKSFNSPTTYKLYRRKIRKIVKRQEQPI